MTTSGWTEVGRFLIFPLSKSTEQPLLMLHKYLGIVDEKRPQDNKSTAMEKGLCFQTRASSDLAEKITELKQALTSSRSSSYRERRLSLEMNTKLLRFRRTMSVDEVNISSRAEEKFASSSKSVDSKNKENEGQKIEDHSLKGEKGRERNTNLRRCVSENVLLTLLEGSGDYAVTLPIISRFSQRRVVEQETVCDLEMENPIEANISSVANPVEEGQKAISLPDIGSAENSKIKSSGTKRNTVRSRSENALKEADKLSSVLDNILDTLGGSSDSERETDSEKEMTKATKEARISRERTVDQFKEDAELDTLSKTLDLIIQDNTSESESSENVGDLNANEQRDKLRKRRDDAKCSLKPPVHPGRRSTKHLERTKSFDKSKQASLIDGNIDRERLSKSKSVDVSSVTSNRRSRQKLSTETSQLRTVSRSPVKTRAQRQREMKNSRSILETSKRNQVISKKHDSVATAKRPVSKGKSVDVNRHRTRREALVKSKSVGNQRNETKGTEPRRKRFSSRSSNSEDDMKAVKSDEAETKHAQQCEKEENRVVMASNEGNKESRLETPKETGEQPDETEQDRRKVDVDHNELRNGQVAFAEQDQTESFSHPAVSATGREQEAVAQDDSSKDVKEQNSDETFYAERDEVNATQREKLDEIVELPNEIQFHFPESAPLQPKEIVCLNTQGNSDDEIVQQSLSISEPVPEIDQDNLLIHNDSTDFHVKENGTSNEIDNSPTESYSQTAQADGRKMTLLDIGKQQSRERLARKNGPVTQLTLEERKQLILGSVDSTPKAKPASKRRSILQIKNRNEGNLVKNKKDVFENATHTSAAVTNSSSSKSEKRRYFRFHGRERKSFEFSHDHLGAVPEDNEGDLGDRINEMAPSKGTQAVLELSGATADSAKTLNDFDDEEAEKNDERENTRSSLNRSPFQFRFRTKRRGFYDLKKRANATGIGSVEKRSLEYASDC
ncbi:PREDICTED: uncharacterized protein LOC107332970 [Acropora digitifera]|uniref:uncharacterized protein LOC107332970 n=1 Tax=Acropora digitifera TaxID=70779 RepID=UPI00077AF765|nr:PREDICTED: uncharacterized protein LOC107332970 [Acropora digitifera]